MSNGAQTQTAATTRRSSGGSEGSGGVQSVDRAITVMEILAREGTAGVSEIANEIGVHKSTAFRLLAALEERDLVEQNAERGKYQLGFGILRLAHTVPTRIDLVKQAQPVIDELAQRFNETINVAVVRAHYVVNVQQAFGAASVATQNWVGQLTPLHATSSGKLLLAYMTEAELDAVLDATGLPRYTEHTVTSRKALLEDLEQIRKEEFSVAYEEFEAGLNAAAVPVRDHTGEVVAALSISGPAYRLHEARIEGLLPELRASGVRISNRMGLMG
jgi:DNA-binding IclR family transcriptional regulator